MFYFKKRGIVLYVELLFVVSLLSCSSDYRPPKAPVKTVSTDYYGVSVEDPYRYMENMDDTVFLGWMKEFSDYSRKELDAIPGRQELMDLMVDFDARRDESIHYLTISKSGRYFYLKTTPSDEIPKLYYRDSYEGEEALLYDPGSFANKKGVVFTITSVTPDYSGSKAAIALTPNGSEMQTLIIIVVGSKKLYPEKIPQFMGMVTWTKDENHFIYGKANSADIHDPDRILNTQLYHHTLGNAHTADVPVYSSMMYPETGMRPEELPYLIYDPDQDDYYLLLITVDRYLKVFSTDARTITPGNKVRWQLIIDQDDKVVDFYPLGNELYLYTAKDAPNFRIIKTSLDHPDTGEADIVIPEPENGLLSGLALNNEALYYKIKYNGVEERLFRMPYGESEATEIELPAKAGTIDLRTRGHMHDEVWVTIQGWTTQGMRYRYLADEGAFLPEPLSSQAEFPEFEDLKVEEMMVPSHDGVMVPLSVIYQKETPLNGSAPLLITGYGAYGKSRLPYFSPYTLAWTLKGGVFAVAHVRGGGELGESWWLSGYKTTKPNTWKDFIACTEYLVSRKYTSTGKIAGYASSAGGILIGRAVSERPDLFAAAVSLAGLMNPLRLEQSPNGPVNAPEFGTIKDSTECMALIEMDPYLHIQNGVKYPAFLVTAGFNDPRVIVWQPAKFAARLQQVARKNATVLFDVDYSSGHGVGDTKTKSFETVTDLLSFALWQTGHPEFQKGD